MRVCVSVRDRMPTLLHGPGCNFGEWYGMSPIVVYYWEDSQSVHGFALLECYGNIMPNISKYYMLVLALCLVDIVFVWY